MTVATAEVAPTRAGSGPVTTVLHVGGLHYASQQVVVEGVLGRRPGVLDVKANAVAQTATVTFDPELTSVAGLRHWVLECGYHCAGQSVPGHVCDPLAEGGREAPHDFAAPERADDADGHGQGGHAGMSMQSMARDMRNRFFVALFFAIPTVLWSMVGTQILGTELPTPFDLARDVWLLLLSLPIVLYASSIFFTGAVAALRARTLDMMVLVAVAIGTAWLYSVAATFFIDGRGLLRGAGDAGDVRAAGSLVRDACARRRERRDPRRCWTWRRRRRWCCATASRSRSPPPRSSSATCC